MPPVAVKHDMVVFLRGNPSQMADAHPSAEPSCYSIKIQPVLPLPPNKRVANDLIVVHFHHYMYDTIIDMLHNSTVHPKQMMNFRDEKPVGFYYERYRKPLCQTLHWA